MAIPSFTPDGILPPGIHECTFDEAQAFLAYNPIRSELWQKLCQYISLIGPIGLYKSIYIDGSYITDKVDPSDIDLVLELCPTPPASITINPRLLSHDYVKKTYSLDAYPYVDPLPILENDFTEFFQYIGTKEGNKRGLDPKDKKGIIKVNI